MRYLKSSFRYVGRHFVRMALYFIAPALVLGLVNSPVSLIRLLVNTDFGESLNFDEVFLGASDLDRGYKVALLVIGFVLYVVCASAAVGSVQHKMRYGQFYPLTVRQFFKKVNLYAIPMALGMIALMIMIELLGLFVTLFVFFWAKAISVTAGIIAMSAITVVVGVACFLCVATLFLFVIPNMTVKGFGFFKSIKRSVSEVVSRFGSLLVAVVLPTVAAYVPLCVIHAFNVPGLMQIADVLFYLFVFMYFHVLMFDAFFDMEDIEREDLKNYGEKV